MNKSLAFAAAAAISITVGWSSMPAQAAAFAIDGNVGSFYASRGGAPLWFSPTSGAAAQQLLQLLATAQADGLNPKRYNLKALNRAVQAAQGGDPAAVRQADTLLSSAFVSYVRDLKHDPGIGIIYVDRELKPAPPLPSAILSDAAHASSLSDYVGQMRWMRHPKAE